MLSHPGFFVPLQGTVEKAGGCSGIGVHTGKEIQLKVFPARAGEGISFVRQDAPHVPISASWKSVVDTRFSTTLGNSEGVTISTVEHLMAAFWALGIDNARVELNGPEVPILDGSSAPWISLLTFLGVKRYHSVSSIIRVLKTLRLQENDSWIEISPSTTFSIDLVAPLGEGTEHQFSYLLGDRFVEEIASARTFSLYENVQKMRAMGLIQGGSLDNAIVIDQGVVLNPEGLRFANECARHKALDFIGDWFLGARLFLGAVKAYAPGHALNHKLLRLLLENENAWEIVSYQKTFDEAEPLKQHYAL